MPLHRAARAIRTTPIDRRRSSTTWRWPAGRRCSCPSPTRSRRTARKTRDQVLRQLRRRAGARAAGGAAGRADRRTGRTSRRGSTAATALETLALGEDGSATHIASQPALEFGGRLQDWVAEIKRGRERGDTIVFVAHTQGRAERTIELLADYDIFAVPIERAEDAHTAVGAGRRRPSDARLPPAGRRRCSSGPRPTSSRRSGRCTSAAGRRRARSSPTSATSRSATSSSTSITASACSSA